LFCRLGRCKANQLQTLLVEGKVQRRRALAGVLAHLAYVRVGSHDRLHLSGDAPKDVIIRTHDAEGDGEVFIRSIHEL